MTIEVLGLFCLLLALNRLSAASGSSESSSLNLVFAAFFAIAGVWIIKRNNELRNAKGLPDTALKRAARWLSKSDKAKKEKQEKARHTLQVEHMAGLPLAQGSACTLTLSGDGASILSSGNTFLVAMNKITAMDVKTSVEIQKAYVSSIGGAIGGAALFGTLGAMVGGRAKEKTSKTTEYYFIVTYLKEGNIDYLSFKLNEADVSRATKLSKEYVSLLSHQTVEL